MTHQLVTSTPIGKLGISLSQRGATRLEFLPEHTECRVTTHPLASGVLSELQCYFENPTQTFSQPLDLSLTKFQQSVLRQLKLIPAGQVRTYAEIASKIGQANAYRAVGNACRNNPVPLLIPCHRVVASTHIGGYCGAQLGRSMEIKRWLLAHEGALSNADT